VLGTKVKLVLKTHLIRLSKMAPSERTSSIQHLLKMRSPTGKQFDHLVTRFIGGAPPVYPLSTADAYYLEASAHQLMSQIRIPFVSFSALDDPILCALPWTEMKEAPYVVSAITRHGGHVGWFEGGNVFGLFGRPKKWVRKPVLEFLRASVDNLIGEWDGRGKDRWKREDGFVMEDEKNNVGYRVIDPSEKIEWLGAPAWIDDNFTERDKFM
jgi:predicted alpha/beta-fold hydrolase